MLLVLFLGGCRPGRDEVVWAPLAPNVQFVGDAGIDGAGWTGPAEPAAPPRCTAVVTCRPEEETSLVFQPPFDRCPPTLGKDPVGQFSSARTRERRANDPHACCYVAVDCARQHENEGWLD